MHTTPNSIDPNHNQTVRLLAQLREVEAESRLVMLRVQTKALETLESLMDEPEPTGDAKKDAIIARERNRRRLSATQALTHIRSIQRQQRTTAKARTKAKKQNPKPTDAPSVPLAARRPVPGRENQSTEPKADPSPPEFTTLDLQQDWLRERKQAMAKARVKRKSRKRGKR